MSTQTFQGLYSDLIGTGLDRIGLESNWIWQEADVIWSQIGLDADWIGWGSESIGQWGEDKMRFYFFHLGPTF